jgi:hypothetical protein
MSHSSQLQRTRLQRPVRCCTDRSLTAGRALRRAGVASLCTETAADDAGVPDRSAAAGAHAAVVAGARQRSRLAAVVSGRLCVVQQRRRPLALAVRTSCAAISALSSACGLPARPWSMAEPSVVPSPMCWLRRHTASLLASGGPWHSRRVDAQSVAASPLVCRHPPPARSPHPSPHAPTSTLPPLPSHPRCALTSPHPSHPRCALTSPLPSHPTPITRTLRTHQPTPPTLTLRAHQPAPLTPTLRAH